MARDMAAYMTARYHRRRTEWIESQGNKCAECGSVEDLEIDHVNPEEKTYTISRILSGGSEAKVQAELAKCQVLCKSCHRDKTNAQIEVPHGGGVSGKKNCDCQPCKAKKSEYNRNYRELRG